MRKGFVSMSVIYSFLLIFLLVLLSILGIYMQKSRLVDGIANNAKNNLQNGIVIPPVIEVCTFTLKDFEYRNGEEIFDVPCAGTYKLEVWGAEGGGDATYYGGKGGYSVGYAQLNAGEIIYANVGGQGNYCTGGACTVVGGYNGGGSCRAYTNSDSTCGSGGGATHIATESGILSSLSSNISSILLVAGGGGGGNLCNVCCNYAAGGAGGGTIGEAAVNLGAPHFTPNGGLNATGGTQTNGASFGQGTSAGSSDRRVGGGGGYWGGIGSEINGAGGGSGYIGDSVTEGSTTAGQRSGDGHARITYIQN